MNTIESIRKQECYGCELCGQVCSPKAISFLPDEEGFVYPIVDSSKCINCGACLYTCPSNYKLLKQREHNLRVYALSLTDDRQLTQSSSGGAAYAIMQYGINNNYYIVGVAYDEDYKGTHYAIANTLQEINDFRGTKYIQARKNDIYRKVKSILDNDGKVIFIGLPCEVAACNAFLGDENKRIIYVELICHGVSSPRIAEQYINQMVNRHGKISWMTIRDKRYGWTPGCIKIVFENGYTYHNLFDSTEYGYAFRNMSRLSCYNCLYKGDQRVADITIGDYWGAEQTDDCWNSNGVSVIFAHTEKGLNIIEHLKDVNLTTIKYSQGIKNNSMINNARQKGNRDQYSKSFCKRGIFEARKENESSKEKTIRLLRNLYYCFKKKKRT